MILKNLINKGIQLFCKSPASNLSNAACSFASSGQMLSACNQHSNELLKKRALTSQLFQRTFSTSETNFSLMEFFDDKKNWAEAKIVHGRQWHVEDLRLKSNTELHKLWYVLHKERNMLLTMEAAYKKEAEPFPSPERIAKVDESMENLLAVVEERNIAFNLLETGETKKIVPYRRYNSFGLIQMYRPREYLVPWWMNKIWKLKYHYKRLPFWSKHYRSLLRVRLRRDRNKIIRQVEYATNKILHKFPQYQENSEIIRSFYEKKYGYTKPMPYHELIRRPAPSEIPKALANRLKGQRAFDSDF